MTRYRTMCIKVTFQSEALKPSRAGITLCRFEQQRTPHGAAIEGSLNSASRLLYLASWRAVRTCCVPACETVECTTRTSVVSTRSRPHVSQSPIECQPLSLVERVLCLPPVVRTAHCPAWHVPWGYEMAQNIRQGKRAGCGISVDF